MNSGQCPFGRILAGTGMEAGGTKARPLCGLGVVFAEGGNDKLKIRKDADFEPRTALSAIINAPSTAHLFRSNRLRTGGKLGLFAAMAAFLALAACSAKKPAGAALPQDMEPPARVQGADVEGARHLFSQPPDEVIRLDGEPRWFEFVTGLPRHLGRPEDAGLKEFRPWPQAMYAAGLLPFYDGLVVAVNRSGLLVMVRGGDTEVQLYTFTEADFFHNYTAAALFYFDEAPAVLLSANDFFLDTQQPPPRRRAFSLNVGKSALVELDIPAFEPYAAEEGWNIEQIFPTFEGLWYFSARKKTEGKGTSFYGRTESSGKSIKIEEVTSSQFYSAKQPVPAENLPPPVKILVERSGLAKDLFWTVTVSSKEDGGRLIFANGTEADAEKAAAAPALYAAYEDSDDIHGAVLLIPPDAIGLIPPTGDAGNEPEAAVFFYDENGVVRHRNLPPLPPAFFWTGIGSCGTTIVAPWEERDNWHIGAAGFLLINSL